MAPPPAPVEAGRRDAGLLDGTAVPWPSGGRLDGASLSGAGGPPASDIRRASIPDCSFVGTLGAVAPAAPQAIGDMTSFDPETGDHTVTLHDPFGDEHWIPVTQAEPADEIDDRRGRSAADGFGVVVAVIRTAHAEMSDGDRSDPLAEGRDAIGRGDHGRAARPVGPGRGPGRRRGRPREPRGHPFAQEAGGLREITAGPPLCAAGRVAMPEMGVTRTAPALSGLGGRVAASDIPDLPLAVEGLDPTAAEVAAVDAAAEASLRPPLAIASRRHVVVGDRAFGLMVTKGMESDPAPRRLDPVVAD